MNTPTPLEQAKALLGEHNRNYVIITQSDDDPTVYFKNDKLNIALYS